MAASVAVADPLPRPKLENYTDYNQFLNDMANYRRHLHDQRSDDSQGTDKTSATGKTDSMAIATPASDDDGSSGSTPPATAATKPAADPDSESNPPPIVVNGPEDLDTAIDQAKSFKHPIYKVTKRFNRSTSQSFPLVQLDQDNLEHAAVSGIWYSQEALPDDRSSLDSTTLQNQADDADKAKDRAKSTTAANQATTVVDEQQAVDELIKQLGAQEAQDNSGPISPFFYALGHDPGHAAAIGISIISNASATQVVAGPQVIQVPNALVHIH